MLQTILSETALLNNHVISDGVSSDGLSSSQSSSVVSTLSSNFQDAQPYKTEFLKYIESKKGFFLKIARYKS